MSWKKKMKKKRYRNQKQNWASQQGRIQALERICLLPFTLLLKRHTVPHFPRSVRRESRSGFHTKLLPQKKRYLHDSISQLLPTQTDKEQSLQAAFSIHPLYGSSETSQGNASVQLLKNTHPFLFPWSSCCQQQDKISLHMPQTSTTDKVGAEDLRTPGRDVPRCYWGTGWKRLSSLPAHRLQASLERLPTQRTVAFA